ncbi:AraC family transcriptional regulator [Marinobacter salinexigens]|uniref:AraC family transcriptional regulator n=1 Tax=Marinobacter salinexigens TaxID=2919747 RepID=A0A5B0VCN9_9GAMM|nr:AraC family transcriptional regulator [Marinobacter salinexigens]KAA1171915.1 AraC family transcriptional regulator [Marinobacter salinexigens]
MDISNSIAQDVPIMSARYAQRFTQFMEKRGVKAHALLKNTDMSEELLTNHESFLSINQVIRLLDNATWLMTDERAPFQFGQQLDLPSHGLLGFAVLGHENPRQLISMIVQYLRVGLPLMDMDLSSTGSTFRIRLIDTWDLGHILPCVTKIYMGSIHRIASQVCDHFDIEFSFSTTMGSPAWQTLAGNSEFRFNQTYSQVTMPLMGRPAKPNDASLEFLMARNRQPQEERNRESDETVMQVRELIMSQPGRPCTTDNIARRLNISTRTLRQHLSAAGTSFRQLRNEIRENFATLYLKDTSVPLESIASKLGFSDQAGFTKAYRAWTGTTPGDIRKQARKVNNTPG